MRQSSGGSWIGDDTAALAADIALTFTETFTVKRKTTGSGNSAGPSVTYAAVVALTAIPGAIDEEKSAQSNFDRDQDRQTTATFFIVSLAADVAEDLVLATDRIVHDDTGIEYELLAILNPATEQVATKLRVAKVNE